MYIFNDLFCNQSSTWTRFQSRAFKKLLLETTKAPADAISRGASETRRRYDGGGSVRAIEMFRDSFKYYKSRNPAPDFGEVIDFENPERIGVRDIITPTFFRRLIANVVFRLEGSRRTKLVNRSRTISASSRRGNGRFTSCYSRIFPVCKFYLKCNSH